ncbi:MAG: hypothetical protein ACM3ZQ_03010 [Bacillota bacterium]
MTIHNLHFLIDLMRKIRAAIADDTLLSLRDHFYATYQARGAGF